MAEDILHTKRGGISQHRKHIRSLSGICNVYTNDAAAISVPQGGVKELGCKSPLIIIINNKEVHCVMTIQLAAAWELGVRLSHWTLTRATSTTPTYGSIREPDSLNNNQNNNDIV